MAIRLGLLVSSSILQRLVDRRGIPGLLLWRKANQRRKESAIPLIRSIS